MLVIRAETHKMLVREANREDPDQTASFEAVWSGSALFVKNSEYDQEILQTNPWHHEEEPHNNHETPGRQTKQSNQLSLFPIKMIAKLEWT